MKTKPQEEESLVISAVDPLNIIGYITPGEKVPALSNGRVTIQNGLVVD